jgi:hypothetical protein
MSMFQITAMEVLKHRNKQGEPCNGDWMHFDDLVVNKHLVKLSWRTPYQNTHKPICNTSTKMLDSNHELADERRKDDPDPCQEMSSIVYTFNTVKTFSDEPLHQLHVSYPNKIKTITQSRSININSLIGNIGGYIGLFLGRIIIRENSSLFTILKVFYIILNLLCHLI